MEAAALLEIDVALLDAAYKRRELFAGERAAPPYALRLDVVGAGRVFSGFSASEGRPRSLRVHRALLRAAASVLDRLGCDVAYVVSDEINVVCLASSAYGGRVEKLDSIASGAASAVASLELGTPVVFDSRVISLHGRGDAARYIVYRARVAFNNYVATVYHRLLGGRRTPRLREMLDELGRAGYSVGSEPPWALYGTCVGRVVVERLAGGAAVKRRRLAALDGLQLCLAILRADDEPPTTWGAVTALGASEAAYSGAGAAPRGG